MISESSAFSQTVFSALCACLELSASSSEASALIRRAYQEPENAPQPPRNADVIYYDIRADDDPVSGFQTPTNDNPTSSSANPSVSSFLSYRLQIVCYGPRSEEYAHRIRSFLYLDGRGYPRQILREAGIYPVPRPPQPVILHEEEASLWRRRADLTISLRVRDILSRTGRRNSIFEAPAISIVKTP